MGLGLSRVIRLRVGQAALQVGVAVTTWLMGNQMMALPPPTQPDNVGNVQLVQEVAPQTTQAISNEGMWEESMKSIQSLWVGASNVASSVDWSNVLHNAELWRSMVAIIIVLTLIMWASVDLVVIPMESFQDRKFMTKTFKASARPSIWKRWFRLPVYTFDIEGKVSGYFVATRKAFVFGKELKNPIIAICPRRYNVENKIAMLSVRYYMNQHQMRMEAEQIKPRHEISPDNQIMEEMMSLRSELQVIKAQFHRFVEVTKSCWQPHVQHRSSGMVGGDM